MSTDSSVTKKLVETLDDAKNGYAKGAQALAGSNEPQLSSTFAKYAQQREAFQHGPSGSRSESPRRVASSSGLTHAYSTRDRARASSESSGASGEGSSVRDVPARRVGGVARRQDALLTRWHSAGTSPGRFGKAVKEPSHRLGQRSDQDEREAPRLDDRRPSGDEQPGAGPDLFIGQNEFEHHPPRGGGEPVAGQ
jgi:hypothetical protein